MDRADTTSSRPARLVLGSRRSRLAVAQTEAVAAALRHHYPDLEVTIKLISTRGDRSQAADRPLADIGGKGLFTAELEQALTERTIDLAVHSAKDLATDLAAGTAVLAWPAREDVRDALIIGTGPPATLASLPPNALVGSSSPRRIGQLKAFRPDLNVQPIRGNVETRIAKVRQGRFAATLLAVAGLRRAGLLAEAAEIFTIEQMLPAAGQGALAVQGRADDPEVARLVTVLDDAPTRRAVIAERALVARLAGGCRMPLGVYVRDDGTRLDGKAVLVHPTGRPRVDAQAQAEAPELLAELLADQLLAGGGRALLEVPL